MTDRGSYTVLEYEQLTAENELRRNEHLETCKLVDKLTAERDEAGRNCTRAMRELDQALRERDALKAEVARLLGVIGREPAELLRDNDRLRAEKHAMDAELNGLTLENVRLRAEVALKSEGYKVLASVCDELKADNERLQAKLDIATKELLYINNCSGTQIQDACHACRTDNERLRAEVEAERGIVRDERKRSDELKAEAAQHFAACAVNFTRLTELREAGEAYMEAPSDEARGLQLRAVLAKVKP